jgi:hypothetical protein
MKLSGAGLVIISIDKKPKAIQKELIHQVKLYGYRHEIIK